VFPFFDYFRINLLENKTADYGTDPFFAYFYLIPANVFAPIALVLLASLLILWIRKPKHVLVWITLPFFVFHCLVGHKEIRFIFPLIPAAILSLNLIFIQNGRLVLPAFLQTEFWRGTWKWLWRYNWCWLILLCIFPFNTDYNINHQKFIYDHRDSVEIYYKAGYDPYREKELIFSFYRPENLHLIEAGNLSSITEIARDDSAKEIYFFGRMPYLDNWPDDLAQRTTIVNASHFVFRWPWFVKKATPILKYVQGLDIIDDVHCPTLFRIAPQRNCCTRLQETGQKRP
jgi:hypothetical protein